MRGVGGARWLRDMPTGRRLQTFALVHPDDRYWILQGLNAAMFLAVGILALAVAFWAAVRRTR